MIRASLAIIFAILMFSACKKTEQVIIAGNKAPPDPTIENVVKETYVNKLYISLLGRKADSLEFQQGLTILDQNNLSASDRNELIDKILIEDEYWDRQFQLALDELLEGADTSDIQLQILIYDIIISMQNDSDIIAYLQAAQVKLNLLLDVTDELKAGTLTEVGMHRRCVDNVIYDDINMGTENFIVSMFENFLFRYPTVDELDKASVMVDGFASIIFLEVGESKDDFINIFLSSNEYYEGQVRNLFIRYLFREPTVDEMSTEGTKYRNTGDYSQLQKNILALDEYVGI